MTASASLSPAAPRRHALPLCTRRTSPTCAQRGRLCARASTSKGEVGRPQPAGRGRTGAGQAHLPDFAEKPKGEDSVRWFQKTRGLAVDGIAGPKTRHALVQEYMSHDGTTLPASVDPVAHGCGENFPVKQLPPEEQASWDRHSSIEDRRVELFFFDGGMGVQPPPAGENSGPGSEHYPEWVRRKTELYELSSKERSKEVILLEMHDELFRTDSAVVLPEGEDPTSKEDGHLSITTVGLVATVLRYNQENPGKRLLVAGHCDTTNTVDYNQKLSEERAGVAHAMLVGDRDEFIKLCDKRHDEVDVTQIFDWTTKAYGFTCKPTRLDAPPSDERYHQFRDSYNAWLDARDPATEPDPRGGPKLARWGRLDKTIWGAILDLYEHNLREELGENAAGVAELRQKVVWVDPGRQALGFSEYFPVDNLGKDQYRSQANRRVEILFFDEGEEPDLEVAEKNPEVSEIYLPGRYEREHLQAMKSGKRLKTTPIRVRLYDPTMAPYGGYHSTIAVDGAVLFDGVTPEDGVVTVEVSLQAARMDIRLQFGEGDETYEYNWRADVDALPGVQTTEGCLIRLRNLGYYEGTQYAVLDDTAQRAVERFQRDWPELTPTGQLDPLTRTRIFDLHDLATGTSQ